MVDIDGRSGRMHAALALAAISLAASPTRVALSQEPSAEDRVMAEALFRTGRELMREKNYEEACRKLEQSQKLVPAAGTLINLAVCHQEEGKLATAWVEYEESVGVAARTNRPDRLAFAQQQMAAMASQVPHVRIVVPKDAHIKGLVIMRGQSEIPQATWGLRVPVDAGTYVVQATAPGFEPWSVELRVQIGQDEVLKIPPLTPAPEAEPPPKPPITALASPPIAKSAVTLVPGTSAQREGDTSSSGLRTAGWLSGGFGLALLGAGGYYGVVALQKRADSDKYCDDRGCYVEGVELNDEAREHAKRSNYLLGAGLVLAGAGAVVLLTVPAPGEEQSGQSAALRMGVGQDGLNATLRMKW